MNRRRFFRSLLVAPLALTLPAVSRSARIHRGDSPLDPEKFAREFRKTMYAQRGGFLVSRSELQHISMGHLDGSEFQAYLRDMARMYRRDARS